MKTFIKGNLEWMSDNLDVTKDREGNELVLGKDYFHPDGDENNVEKYGLLYTLDAAMRACPPGWRLPTIYELSNEIIISNEFSALPAGSFDGSFYEFGKYAIFWTATPYGIYTSCAQYLNCYTKYVGCGYYYRNYEFSVRCVRDL